MKQVIVDIDTMGGVKIDALGFTGAACEKATEAIEVAIGGPVAKDKKRKPDFFKATAGNTVVKRTF